MNAVAYLRVSGASQIDGTGFDRQASACIALAALKGFTIVETFREEAISGTNDLEDRPAFQAMVRFMLDSGTKVLIVEQLDRLARQYRLQEHLILYLAAKNLTLYAANTGENITEAMMGDPMKVAMVQMQGVFAQLDRSMIVAKLKKGRERTRAKTGRTKLIELGLTDDQITEVNASLHGRCEGRKPFGEDPKLLAEAPILAEIRAQRAAGLRPRDIAATLNIDAVPTRSGAPWRGSVVAKILRRNPGKAGSTHFAPPSCAIARTSTTVQPSLLPVKPVLQ